VENFFGLIVKTQVRNSSQFSLPSSFCVYLDHSFVVEIVVHDVWKNIINGQIMRCCFVRIFVSCGIAFDFIEYDFPICEVRWLFLGSVFLPSLGS
jgi:hypothetical protein